MCKVFCCISFGDLVSTFDATQQTYLDSENHKREITSTKQDQKSQTPQSRMNVWCKWWVCTLSRNHSWSLLHRNVFWKKWLLGVGLPSKSAFDGNWEKKRISEETTEDTPKQQHPLHLSFWWWRGRRNIGMKSPTPSVTLIPFPKTFTTKGIAEMVFDV